MTICTCYSLPRSFGDHIIITARVHLHINCIIFCCTIWSALLIHINNGTCKGGQTEWGYCRMNSCSFFICLQVRIYLHLTHAWGSSESQRSLWILARDSDSPQWIRRDFHRGQADMGQAECWAEELPESRQRVSRFPGKEQRRKEKTVFKVCGDARVSNKDGYKSDSKTGKKKKKKKGGERKTTADNRRRRREMGGLDMLMESDKRRMEQHERERKKAKADRWRLWHLGHYYIKRGLW